MIDPVALLAHPIPTVRQVYTQRDTMLYALGLGLGRRSSPTYADELRFVYEKNLAALPTMGLVLGYPGLWMADPATGIDVKRLLHGGQVIRIARPLPVAGEVIGESRVLSVVDKGPGRDAVVVTRRDVSDAGSGELLCQLDVVSVLRGQGGFGGGTTGTLSFASIPDRKPDHVARCTLDERAALIYRLSGDYNPLHVDEALAANAGFRHPILHGLCTLGTATCQLSRAALQWQVDCIACIEARFSAPTWPGQRLRTEVWKEGGDLRFRCFAEDGDTDTCVLDNGRISLAS